MLAVSALCRAQQPFLQLQGEAFFGGAMTLHVTAPADVGEVVFLALGLDPLPPDAPVATGKGPWYIGQLLTTYVIGAIPTNGRLDMPFLMPPVVPGAEGTTLVLQCYVAPSLSNPAILPLDLPHHLPGQALGLLSPNPVVGANFGDRVATGDLNDDGVTDLVVGAWFEDIAGMDKAGRVYVLWGPSFATHATLSPAVPADYGTYGASVTVADLTGDGIQDLLVAETPPETPGPGDHGLLHLFEGKSAFSPAPAATISSPGSGLPYSNYGRTVVTGDFNGDGWQDIAVGNMNEKHLFMGEVGQLDVFWGPGFTATTIIPNPTPKASDFFGSALAVGDVNGDGLDDLIEGSGRADSSTTVNQGRAHVYAGPGLALYATLENPFPQGFNSRFGEQVSCGDLDGDGLDEVIVCDLKNRVYCFEAPGLASFVEIRKPSAIDTVAIGSVSFGYYLAATDMNADGFVDVLISDVFEGSLTGCALAKEGLLFAAMGPYVSTFHVVRSSAPVCGDVYSWAFRCVDLDGDGTVELVVNSPTADLGGVQNSGLVQVLGW